MIHKKKIKIKDENKSMWFLETKWLKNKYALKSALVEKIYSLCCLGFKQERNTNFKRDVERHIMDEDMVCLIFKKEIELFTSGHINKSDILCFISYRVLDAAKNAKMVYFSGVVVDPEFQGRGIASSIMQTIMEKENTRWGGLRTQNPVMYKSLEKICPEVYPSLPENNNLPPEQFRTLGIKIARMLGMKEYIASLMIEKNTYGTKSLYGSNTSPTLKNNSSLDTAFKEVIQGGDSMIVIGRREK